MSFDPADPIGSVFAPVLGKPCWNVRPGLGSAFMLEFGEPHLEIRQPLVSTSASEKVRILLARRKVVVVGDWSLLIEFCGWRVLQDGALVAHSNIEPPPIEPVAEVLDGQKLVSVNVSGAMGTSRFEFDLGGTMETSRFDADSTGDWTLFAPGDMCLSYRADGRYSWGPDSRIDDPREWIPLPATP